MSKSPRRRPIKPGPFGRRQKGRPATDVQLRQLFNDGGILEKVKNGEFTSEIVKESHPSPPRADEPECTKSQLLAYFDEQGKKIAEAHCYIRTDGTIGASGKPDPKEVVHEGILYYIDVQ